MREASGRSATQEMPLSPSPTSLPYDPPSIDRPHSIPQGATPVTPASPDDVVVPPAPAMPPIMGPVGPVGGLIGQVDCSLEVRGGSRNVPDDDPADLLGDNYQGCSKGDDLGWGKFDIRFKKVHDSCTPVGLAAINKLGISYVEVDHLAALELIHGLHNFDPDGKLNLFKSTPARYVCEREFLMPAIAGLGFRNFYSELDQFEIAGVFGASHPAPTGENENGGFMHAHVDKMLVALRESKFILKVTDSVDAVQRIQIYDEANYTLHTIVFSRVIIATASNAIIEL